MAEQLICNQQVVGSTPITSSKGSRTVTHNMGDFPSGQRGQTVNLLCIHFGGPNPPSPTNTKSTRLGAFCVGGRMMPRGTPRELCVCLGIMKAKNNSPYERSEVVVTNPPSPTNKKGTFVYQKFLFCLSKPQTWYIIAARSAVHIIKGGKPPLYLISPFGAVSLLRLDDIQCFALMIFSHFVSDDIHFLRK